MKYSNIMRSILNSYRKNKLINKLIDKLSNEPKEIKSYRYLVENYPTLFPTQDELFYSTCEISDNYDKLRSLINDLKKCKTGIVKHRYDNDRIIIDQPKTVYQIYFDKESIIHTSYYGKGKFKMYLHTRFDY